MATNANLTAARNARNDEFYTRLEDVEAELLPCADDFRGRRVLCPCDGPESAFVRFCLKHWDRLGVTHLTASQYNPMGPLFGFGRRWEWDGPDDRPEPVELDDEGSVLGVEAGRLMDRADLIVTNPPFSILSDIIPRLEKWGGLFSIMGPLPQAKAVTIAPYFLSDRLWLGRQNGSMAFATPDATSPKESCDVMIDGVRHRRFGNIVWYTNLPSTLPREPFVPTAPMPTTPVLLDGTDILECGQVADVPAGWDGPVAVPLTFLTRWTPADPGWRIVDMPGQPTAGGRALFARVVIERR